MDRTAQPHLAPEQKPRGGRWGQPLDQRFWSKVRAAPADQCWIWTASLNTGGYGQIMLNGRPHRAHRVAYEMLVGPIPVGLHLDHLCREKRCVNPSHLEPVSPGENVRRAGPFREYKLKSHCKHGHKFTPENTYHHPAGYRACRTCERRHSLASYYRRTRG